MEALSAIGLAGNIIQFVDFGAKFISILAEISKSPTGRLQEHDELEDTARDLEQQSSAINSALNTSGDLLMTKHLAKCKAIASELTLLLAGLKQSNNQHGITAGLRGSIRVLRSKEAIKDLERRLNRTREAILTRLQVLLFEQRTTLENSLQTLHDREKSLHDATTKRLDNLIDGLRAQESLTKQLPADFAANIQQFQAKMVTQQIIKSLYFPQIREREFAIPDAHRTTFDWIFDSRTTNFSSWLRSHGGMFWISGKAGSGKSTLMKFLLSRQRTDSLLRDWAGQKQLIMASHFFWSQGTKEQRSQTGLFQTLLSQILVQCPQLISFLPKRRQHTLLATHAPWSLPELLECFSALSSASLPNTRICLFVDGLDEYDGDHRELIGILQVLAKSTNIKICASSRPWVEFISAFGDLQWKLAVQDLTGHDILTYVSDNLKSHKGFKELSSQAGNGAEKLIRDITNKAQGVFLWVYLVVRSLIRGMGNKDTLQDLQVRLNELPDDLERYFTLMMDSIEGLYRQRTAKVFRVLLQTETTVPVLTFHFLDEEAVNPDYALGDVVVDVSKNPEDLKQHQLIAQCRDLVHITRLTLNTPIPFKYGVGFLHRTVADYFKTPGLEALLIERSGQDFDPRLSLCRSLLAQFKTIVTGNIAIRSDVAHALLREFTAGIIHFTVEIEYVNRRSEKRILDSLDATIVSLDEHVSWAILTGITECQTLLQLATRCGMSLYIRETAVDDDKRGKALLASLKNPISVGENEMSLCPYDDLDLKMAKELLASGASPNCRIKRGPGSDYTEWATPWLHFVRTLQDSFARGASNPWGMAHHLDPDSRPGGPQITPKPIAYSVCHLLLSRGAEASDADWRLFQENLDYVAVE
ncbi:uncharacterized protein B0H64DRAFT_476757 [Chaetomium fimeti]|uniref:NACHT domain-containing protein n=1 Tax=Chaetomium fimeti TaxID=1854472 RepID=A0AAE0HAW5_9PEZI|nr:hypothetical protein B0H64DRAFT_476757 [Chaetomium fimeti]